VEIPKIGCFGRKYPPFRVKIPKMGCLGQKYTILGENPKSGVLRLKIPDLGLKSQKWGV